MIDIDFLRLVNLHKIQYPSSTTRIDSTPIHNQLVGGAPHSWHIGTREGGAKAIDLVFDRQADLIPAAKYAKSLGFGGIEIDLRNKHLHLDMRPSTWHVVIIGPEYQHQLTLVDFLALPQKV